MADGSSRAVAIRSEPPAKQSAQRPGIRCLRCEDMELVDCDLCDKGGEDCPRCEGMGLIVCSACEEGSPAPAALAASLPLTPKWYVAPSRAVAIRRAPHHRECTTKEKSGIDSPGLQPEAGGAAGCASRLKWARLRRQMTLDALAHIAGYSVGALRSYEQGRPASGPPLRAIEDLAQALRVRRSWLAFGLGAMEPAQGSRKAEDQTRGEPKLMEATQ